MNSTLNADWQCPAAIRFGCGRIAELAQACEGLQMGRPLWISDARMPATESLAASREALTRGAGDLGRFAPLSGLPGRTQVEAALRYYRDCGHDGLIAVGGWAALALARVVAALAGQDEGVDCGSLAAGSEGGGELDPARTAPCVVVPVSAGGAGQVGAAAMLFDEQSVRMCHLSHPGLRPALVIADPELTLVQDPSATAASGMDALVRALEAYCAPVFDPMAAGSAVEALRLTHEWLPLAYADGADLRARTHLLAAALAAAAAQREGAGAAQALAHALCAHYQVHPGVAKAALLPPLLLFNRALVAPKLARLGAWLGLTEASFDGVLSWLLGLRGGLGLPNALGELGFEPDRPTRVAIAAAAGEDPALQGNPRPLQRGDLEALLGEALDGGSGR